MTVSIRASLLFSAFAMAALTDAFANPPSDDAVESTHPKHWSYGGEGGPEHWSELAPENAPCSAGVQQSPIDLSGALIATVDTPHPKWIPVRGGTVVNNGHTIQVDLGNAGGIRLDGEVRISGAKNAALYSFFGSLVRSTSTPGASA